MDPLFWALILIAIAIFVMALELFIPSAGVLGFLAAGLVLTSIFMAFRASWPIGALFLLGVMVCLPVLIYGLLKAWPHTPIGKRILLDEPAAEQILPPRIYSEELVGQIGLSKTKMLPSGIILVNDEKLDAVSDGFPIDANQPIKITAIRANRIYVQPYEFSGDADEPLPARDDQFLTDNFEDLGLGDFRRG
jgi:membrane-bound ClpP family serine protease